MAIVSYVDFRGKIGDALFYQRHRLDFAEGDIERLRSRVSSLEKKDFIEVILSENPYSKT